DRVGDEPDVHGDVAGAADRGGDRRELAAEPAGIRRAKIDRPRDAFPTHTVEKEPRAVIGSAQPSTHGAFPTHTVEKAPRAWAMGTEGEHRSCG
ncbi:MAG: hypothetical protein KDB58_00385, partial [Solirubrobacterales bacterium]|nr:hypothetical protein [Solirubrobacterales bacterium]